MFEHLESRRLFALTVTLDGSVLNVVGTDAPEEVGVTQSGGWIDVTEVGVGLVASLPEGLVTRVTLDGLGGDDILILQSSVGGDVFGGEGNDQIQLTDDGPGVSFGYGGNNDDLLIIVRGNGTTACGGNGKDTLFSLETVNTTYLYGDNATDTLNGTSTTVIDGGNGKDIINGVPGQ